MKLQFPTLAILQPFHIGVFSKRKKKKKWTSQNFLRNLDSRNLFNKLLPRAYIHHYLTYFSHTLHHPWNSFSILEQHCILRDLLEEELHVFLRPQLLSFLSFHIGVFSKRKKNLRPKMYYVGSILDTYSIIFHLHHTCTILWLNFPIPYTIHQTVFQFWDNTVFWEIYWEKNYMFF